MSAYQKVKDFLFPKSIAARLAEACSKVSDLTKKGDNGAYTYLRILDVANALRDELFSRGIVLIPNDVECHERFFPSPIEGRAYTEIRVKTQFTVTDGRSSQFYCAYGVGRDLDGKALFAAQTGALKSWLKRLGLIFGERDDPEVEAPAKSRDAQANVEELPRAVLAQRNYQKRALEAAIQSSGKMKPEIEALLSEAMGSVVTCEAIEALNHADFDVAMRIITRHGDATEILAKSVKAAKRKPKVNGQPIVAALEHQDPTELAGD